MIAGDFSSCLAVADNVDSTSQMISFYRQVVQPSMYNIGEAWMMGNISISQEHLASSLSGRVASTLHARFISPSHTKGRVIVSGVPSEYHELGAWVIADALELEGWEVRYLGANVPVSVILNRTMQFRPHLLALSITMPANIESARQVISEIRQLEPIAATTVLVGGNAMNIHQGIWQNIGADGYAEDIEKAVVFTRQFWERLPESKLLP